MTDDIVSVRYKALFKETFSTVLNATGNEQLAESAATEHVLSAALLSAGIARREMGAIAGIRAAFGIPSTRVH